MTGCTTTTASVTKGYGKSFSKLVENPESFDWAEAKYRDELEADAERKAAPPPTKYPSYGLQISTDSFRNELYHYRDAVEAFATACEQIELVKGMGTGKKSATAFRHTSTAVWYDVTKQPALWRSLLAPRPKQPIHKPKLIT